MLVPASVDDSGTIRRVATLADMKARIDAASTAYAAEFAGKNRATRDLDRLDALLADMRAIVTVLERRLGPLRPAEKELLNTARKKAELFARERAAIAEEKKRPPFTPEEQVLVDLGARAKVAQGMHRRAFRPDAERIDLAVLYEVSEEMETIEARMRERMPARPTAWMAEALTAVRIDVEGCRQHHLKIVEAWSTGDVDARREFVHALVGDQLASIDEELRGVPRDAWRPTRLRHVVDVLRLLGERIRALSPLTGADGEVIAQLEDRAEALRHDLDRLGTQPADEKRIAALGRELEAARAVYQKNFAGLPRKDVSAPLLRQICTRVASVALQAFDARDVSDSAGVVKLLRRSRELLWTYENEESAVGDQQATR